jgi:hypothetical protein
MRTPPPRGNGWTRLRFLDNRYCAKAGGRRRESLGVRTRWQFDGDLLSRETLIDVALGHREG